PIHGVARDRCKGHRGRDEHDRSARSRTEKRQCESGHAERTDEVHLDVLAASRGRLGIREGVAAKEAGAVDEHVEPTELALQPGDRLACVVFGGDVDAAGVEGGCFRPRSLQPLLVAPGNRESVLSCEASGELEPDPGSASGHENPLADELHSVPYSSWRRSHVWKSSPSSRPLATRSRTE